MLAGSKLSRKSICLRQRNERRLGSVASLFLDKVRISRLTSDAMSRGSNAMRFRSKASSVSRVMLKS